MKIATVFSGIGAPEQGAKRVYNDLDLVFACEWDKYARDSFKANYEIENKHFHKDICDLDGTQYKGKVDILIGGSPCQDFSLAGLRKGIDGNKGILIYEYIRIIQEVNPPIFIYENVKGMLSDKKGRTIKEFVQAFREMGYNCHYEVLNTKDYGVPQNRERIFLVGFKNIEHYYNFSFAPKMKLEKRLKDVLESDVDEKYYLSDKMIEGFTGGKSIFKERFNPIDLNEQDYGFCLDCRCGGGRRTSNFIKVASATKKGYETAAIGDSINLTHPRSKTRRGRVGKQVSQTLDCACNQTVIQEKPRVITVDQDNNIIPNTPEIGQANRIYSNDGISPALNCGWTPNTIDYKIRKLTPRECFRLQDFPDDFKFIVSNTQLYKQAGNSISVNVMEMIFNQIEKSRYQNTKTDTLF
jgi:DNA (cytosine-5)-methyltransferase 1